jgi:hypothetical protein
LDLRDALQNQTDLLDPCHVGVCSDQELSLGTCFQAS